jgi:hypothetical protein
MHPTVGEWLRPQPLEPFEPADGDAWLREDEAHWERFGFGPWAVIERASGELELDEVVAMILPINAASRRVAEKIGMEPAGEVEHAGFDHLLLRSEPRLDSPR